MPLLFLEYLDGHNVYACKACKTHLTALSELVSVHYRSQHGDAYLFHKVYSWPHLGSMCGWAANTAKT